MPNILQTNNPSGQVITPESTAKRIASSLLILSKSNYQSLVRMQKDGIKSVWSPSGGATPQQVCDALGTNAAKLFDFHAALTECIVNIATRDGIQPDISLPTNAFTRNPDGTVTISDQPYQP